MDARAGRRELLDEGGDRQGREHPIEATENAVPRSAVLQLFMNGFGGATSVSPWSVASTVEPGVIPLMDGR